MNYVSAVYAVVVFIIAVDWFVRGKREYRGQEQRHIQADDVLAKVPTATGHQSDDVIA